MAVEHLDVLVVGAGLSGVGADAKLVTVRGQGYRLEVPV